MFSILRSFNLVMAISVACGGCSGPAAGQIAADGPEPAGSSANTKAPLVTGPPAGPVATDGREPAGSATTKETLLACIIRSEPKCEWGKAPKIAVQIVNHAGRDIYLVGSLDASDCGTRYPHCYFEIVGPSGKPITDDSPRCGYMNLLRQQDFVRVASGGTFDPYQQIDNGFFPSHLISPDHFSALGEYRIRFVYSTDCEPIGGWLGNEKLNPLLRQVPKMKVVSNEIKITVIRSESEPPSVPSSLKSMPPERPRPVEIQPCPVVIKMAEAELAQTQTKLQRANADWERAKALWQFKAISRADYDGAKDRNDLAKTDVMKAEAALAKVKQMLQAATSVSPATLPSRTTPGRVLPQLPGQQPPTITNSIGMKLVLIPAGEFMMGSPESEKGRHNDEPQHRVRITKPFYLGQYPVTLGQFLTFYHDANYKLETERDGKGDFGTATNMKNTKRPWAPGFENGNDHPVVFVSWNDAVAFCEWLSRKEGRSYRLPTEAQWEYACRAGTTTPFNFGSVLNGHQANCNGNYPYGTKEKGPYLERTSSVGSYRPNAFGLYDMHGNVWQWCADWYDWYDSRYYGKSATDDPTGPDTGSARVKRGGSWADHAITCRSAKRGDDRPGFRIYELGFRVARVAD
jgi:formylglycine-generating enzyme required for sulfatase activity